MDPNNATVTTPELTGDPSADLARAGLYLYIIGEAEFTCNEVDSLIRLSNDEFETV